MKSHKNYSQIKINVYYVILFFLPILSFSQSTFELNIQNEFDQEGWGLIKTSNGNFICGINNQSNDIQKHVKLYKFNQSGEILLESSILISSFRLKALMTFENYFLAIGSYSDSSEIRNEICIKKFNYQLDSIGQFILSNITDVNINQTYSMLNHKGNIVTSGFGFDNHYPKIFIFETDTAGNLLQNVNFLGDDFGWTSGILEKNDHRGYYIFTYGGFIINGTQGEVVILDNSFNIDTVIISPNDINYQYSARWIAENEYILAGRTMSFDPLTEYLGIVRADTTHNFSYSFETGTDENRDAPAFLKSMDFISKNNIYFGGTYDYMENTGYTPFQDKENVITLCNFNEYLELNWQIFYGGDAFYNLYYVVATDDGGCLLMGTRYDADNHENYRDIYILKVDSLGNYSSSSQPEIELKKLLVYPNPGADVINFKLSLDSKADLLQLYNITGKLVLQEIITNQKFSLNTDLLNQDLYFYRIYNKKKLIAKGKWVKQ